MGSSQNILVELRELFFHLDDFVNAVLDVVEICVILEGLVGVKLPLELGKPLEGELFVLWLDR